MKYVTEHISRIALNRWVLTLIVVVSAAMAGKAFCAKTAGTGKQTQRIQEIDRRKKLEESRQREWDEKARDLEKLKERAQEYLSLKVRDRNQFAKTLADTKSLIEERKRESETTKNSLAERQLGLRERWKVFAQFEAGMGAGASYPPDRLLAASALRSRCRQLALQTRTAREDLESKPKELADLYDKRARYEAFTDFAKNDNAAIEAQIHRHEDTLKAIAAHQRQEVENIKTLDDERQRLNDLMAGLRREPAAPPVVAAAPRSETFESPRAGTLDVPARRNDNGLKGEKPTSFSTGPMSGESSKVMTARLLTAPQGTPVLAAEDGTVLYAGPFEGWGNLVVIAHEHSMATVYSFLSEISVRANLNVYKGQEIGVVGPVGNGTDNGVRFEVRQGKAGATEVPPDSWKATAGDLRGIVLGSGPKNASPGAPKF
jgi:hypothetical protein